MATKGASHTGILHQPIMPAPWDFSSAAKPSSSIEVEKPLGYHRGAQQQQVQEARAGKASIEEVKKERALKQRVRHAMNPSLPLVPSLLPFRLLSRDLVHTH